VIIDSNKTQIISNNEFTQQKFIITREPEEAYAHVFTISYGGPMSQKSTGKVRGAGNIGQSKIQFSILYALKRLAKSLI